MTATAQILETFKKLSKKEQGEFLYEMAKCVIADHAGDPTIRLADADGRCLGFLFGAERATTVPRPLTPEEHAEDARRMANLDNAVTAEEVIALARAGSRAPAPR
ncbi:MAG TPA: hypothetical protein VKE40_13125 [Gemmataceae bacterium]|nr:hypothetical protein [Gemmataceae bacterium]